MIDSDINAAAADRADDADTGQTDIIAPRAPLRSFGRRRSRKLSPRQSQLLDEGLQQFALDLSAPAPADLGAHFAMPGRPIWLEIGFGGGEHLLWQAQHNRDVCVLGCEPFIDGIVKVIDGVRAEQLTNLRVHADDARDVLPWLPAASIERAFVLFPDPWPKKRHVKRRLVNPVLLQQLATSMKPGAELRLGTDIADYARAMLFAVRQQGDFLWAADKPEDWRVRPADWPATRYEQKAIREGRRCYFLRFCRR